MAQSGEMGFLSTRAPRDIQSPGSKIQLLSRILPKRFMVPRTLSSFRMGRAAPFSALGASGTFGGPGTISLTQDNVPHPRQCPPPKTMPESSWFRAPPLVVPLGLFLPLSDTKSPAQAVPRCSRKGTVPRPPGSITPVLGLTPGSPVLAGRPWPGRGHVPAVQGCTSQRCHLLCHLLPRADVTLAP